MSDVTRILSQIEQDDPRAAKDLLPVVYDELRQMAATKMAQERSDHTLQATALVHEAYVRLLASSQSVSWENRRHFFAAAAEAMRRVLVDAARKRNRAKRGGDWERIGFDLDELPGLGPNQDIADLYQALDSFSQKEPEKAELVKLRFFAGLTIEQAAEILGISTSTADRHWSYARAWLFREIAQARQD